MNDNEKYMNMLKKAAGSSVAMIAIRLALFGGSVFTGVVVGKKINEMSDNKLAAVGAGIGTTVVVDTAANRLMQPIYKSYTKSIVSMAEDIAEDMEQIKDELTPEEREAANEYNEKIKNFKEKYNI